jgi:hypothetical protein
MTRLGITGHQAIPDPAAWTWVRQTIRAIVKPVGPEVTGLSSLAEGSDQIFAEEVLRAGGQLIAVIPFRGYERAFGRESSLSRYSKLRQQAESEVVLDKQDSDQRSFLVAGQYIASAVDRMLAVWDEQPARGIGGTADIVHFCHEIRKPVSVLNPVTLVQFDVDW